MIELFLGDSGFEKEIQIFSQGFAPERSFHLAAVGGDNRRLVADFFNGFQEKGWRFLFYVVFNPLVCKLGYF